LTIEDGKVLVFILDKSSDTAYVQLKRLAPGWKWIVSLFVERGCTVIKGHTLYI